MKSQDNKNNWLRIALWLVLGGLLIAVASLATLLMRLSAELPSLDKVVNYQPQLHLQIYTSDGVPIAQYGTERRQFVPIAEVPALLQGAVLAVEDSRFARHHGIDPIGVLRALVANLQGGMRQGASTVTQQVARNFFLSPSKTMERKLKEALLALQIEDRLSKPQILELYMNQIYLGQRAYGFSAAAQTYFGKPLSALSIAETAMLAGLPQNPSYANPVVNPARARSRQHLVLSRMRKVGLISDAQLAQARSETLAIRSPVHAEVHAEYVAEMARQFIQDRFGDVAYAQGYKVYTTVRAVEQQAAYAALRRTVMDHERRQAWRGPEGHEKLPEEPGADVERAAALALKDYQDDEDLPVAIVTEVGPDGLIVHRQSGERLRLPPPALQRAQAGLAAHASDELALKRGAIIRLARGSEGGWAIGQWPQAQAAFVALDPVNGHIRALVGGFDFNRSSFNRVTQAWRQAGSSIKPFLYSAALEHALMPGTMINDAPLAAPGDTGSVSAWQPRNADGRYEGPVSMRQGLVRSRNVVSVRLLQEVGLETTRSWIGQFGFDLSRQPTNPTLALGSGLTTPLQLARAYAVLAQNGHHQGATMFIERVTDAQGMVIYQPPRLPVPGADDRAIPERNAFVVNSMLQDVMRTGTAALAHRTLMRDDIYGKTGTTNDAVDAWFAGFHPGLVAVAWMGYDEPRSLGDHESGSVLALPMWIAFMSQALHGVPEQQAGAPDGVIRIDNEWRYSEWALGGEVDRVGFDLPVATPTLEAAARLPGPPPPTAPAAAAQVAPAASSPVL